MPDMQTGWIDALDHGAERTTSFHQNRVRPFYRRIQSFIWGDKRVKELEEFNPDEDISLGERVADIGLLASSSSLVLAVGAIAAGEDDLLERYVHTGLATMWESGLKMDDPEVFVQGLTEAGLDGAALLARTQDPAVKEQLKSNTEAAIARGCFGAPTFFVGDELFFGKDRLGDLEDEVNRVS